VFANNGIKLQANSTGVRVGNALTDSHLITGSVGVTGSFTVFSRNNPEFRVVDNGTFMGNLATDIHRITGSVNITGSILVNGGGITASLQGVALSASYVQPKAYFRGQSNGSFSVNTFGGTRVSALWSFTTFYTSSNNTKISYNPTNFTLNLTPGTYKISFDAGGFFSPLESTTRDGWAFFRTQVGGANTWARPGYFADAVASASFVNVISEGLINVTASSAAVSLIVTSRNNVSSVSFGNGPTLPAAALAQRGYTLEIQEL
jgi:hypothetical protein